MIQTEYELFTPRTEKESVFHRTVTGRPARAANCTKQTSEHKTENRSRQTAMLQTDRRREKLIILGYIMQQPNLNLISDSRSKHAFEAKNIQFKEVSLVNKYNMY